MNGVSCPSESLCVAVGGLDTLAVSQAPTAGAASWQVISPAYPNTCAAGAPNCTAPGGRLHAISCASPGLCVAASYEGIIYVSTDPTGGVGAWSPTVVNDGQGNTHLSGVSCPSPSLCVAVAGGSDISDGKVLTSTDPTSGQWQETQLDGSLDFRGVSCASPSLCVAVARGGQIVVSTDPTGGASAWSEAGAPGGPGDLGAVSCVTGVLCAAGNATGNLLTSIDPAGAGPAWGEANGGGSVQITGASCPTTLLCAAVDNNGDVLNSTDPTAGPGSWTFQNLVPFPQHLGIAQPPGNALFAVSCASASLCVLVGSESRIFTATNPFSAPSEPLGRHPGNKVKRRPRTILLFAEGFWKDTPARHHHRIRARFRFFSPSRVRGFVCQRDSGRYRLCHSPLRYWVPLGRHVLRVRAIGPTGLRGPAAIDHFRTRRP